jgi:hypothetical protein
MDKSIVLTVAGAVMVAGVIWLTTRSDESAAGETHSATPGPMTVTPATYEAKVSADSPKATPVAATLPAQSTGEALPIDVSPGFEYLSTPPAEMQDTHPLWSVWRRHQKLQSESRDGAWAPRIETSLRDVIEDSLTANGFDTQRIELPVLECRTSACEIQAIGYAQDNMKPGVDLQSIVFAMMAGNLGNEFDRDGLSINMSSRADGRLTYLVSLPRKKP